MKIPLRYQQTEYDCGPTSLLNAISYLFDREEIPPAIIREIILQCVSTKNDKGEYGKRGTAVESMMFLGEWFNKLNEQNHLSISSKFLGGSEVFLGEKSEITETLNKGGVAVVKVLSDYGHYLLITKIKDGKVYVFDPYLRDRVLTEEYINKVDEHPFEYNHIVEEYAFNKANKDRFAFGPVDKREAIIILKTND